MSDDAIQDLISEASTYATAATSFATIQRAQEQHRATLATLNSLQEYIKAEREARFCTSDAVTDLFDQLFMQCMDCVPEYANFIKAAEDQHAKNLATIAELRSALEGRAAEVALRDACVGCGENLSGSCPCAAGRTSRAAAKRSHDGPALQVLQVRGLNYFQQSTSTHLRW